MYGAGLLLGNRADSAANAESSLQSGECMFITAVHDVMLNAVLWLFSLLCTLIMQVLSSS